jgi:hypothetical protein
MHWMHPRLGRQIAHLNLVGKFFVHTFLQRLRARSLSQTARRGVSSGRDCDGVRLRRSKPRHPHFQEVYKDYARTIQTNPPLALKSPDASREAEGEKGAPFAERLSVYPSAAYGVMVRLTINELLRGFAPPVVALTTNE